ncbi:MAG: dihydroorotate dehydrogenase electron transfer subunit [Caldisericia bacterium]|nr:dihydroorotate dehydrogenase electron transfer subunit [Caldisericia bacterium]
MIEKTNSTILSNEKLASSIYLLKLKLKEQVSEILPGQFIQLACTGNEVTLLKRPFSIMNAYNDTIDILYKVVGKGTLNLSQMKASRELELLIPCGNYFSTPTSSGVNLLIGGGVGIAPLFFLTKKFPDCHFDLWYGTSRKNERGPIDNWTGSNVKFHFHSDWNTVSNVEEFQGTILDAYKENSTLTPSKIYTCGPTIMMNKITENWKNKIPIEVSLEARMACGFGVCLGCSFKTTSGQKTVCSDGPVFNGETVVWESL